MEIIAYIFAGLGLFFLGVSILSDNLKLLVGREVKKRISSMLSNSYISVLWGGVFITLTQSSSAATFILIGALKSGMLRVRQAIPAIIGINLFGAVTALFLAINLKLTFLFLLGVSIFFYTSKGAGRSKKIFGVLLGISMIFIGLYTMKDGVAPITHYQWFDSFVRFANSYYIIGLFVGIILNLLTQSTLAVVAILISFHSAGVLTLSTGVIVAFGSCVGAAIFIFILGAKLTGAAKQIALFHGGYNIVGAIILVTAFFVGHLTGYPFLEKFITSCTSNFNIQLVLGLFIFEVVAGVITFCLKSPIERWLRVICKPSFAEELSKAKYIDEYSIDDLLFAIDTVKKEQRRQIVHLRDELALINNKGQNNSDPSEIFEAINDLSITTNEFIIMISAKHSISDEESKQLNLHSQIQSYIVKINDELRNLYEEFLYFKKSKHAQEQIDYIIEGIDVMFITLVNVIDSRDINDIAHLEQITSKSMKMNSKFKQKLLVAILAEKEKKFLVSAFNRMERVVWLIKHIGRCSRNI